jgi:hypothetical protein
MKPRNVVRQCLRLGGISSCWKHAEGILDMEVKCPSTTLVPTIATATQHRRLPYDPYTRTYSLWQYTFFGTEYFFKNKDIHHV